MKEVFQIVSECLAESLGMFTSVTKAQKEIEKFAKKNNLEVEGILGHDVYLYSLKEDGSRDELYDVFYMTTYELDKKINLEV